ncbi:membrane-spanning 4-domains subfamily A member 15-like [Centroberyx affinis]|uniref:membrane-spanning 4-domains subfamily A member 15-like n=1 Tax=Centroberyx affinis TaxID=166261 RepID=UPI003A5C5485
MSVTVDKGKGVTVVTIAANSKSACPALCQILGTLCYSPVCCSVSRELLQASAPVALGTIQIMVGLFNIGLGPGRTSTHPGDLTHLGAAYWLGAVYIIAGIVCILAGRFPSPCLVGFTVFMNIVGALFAITGIALYAIDLGDASLFWMCNWGNYYDYGYGGYYDSYGDNRKASSDEKIMRERLKQHYDDKCRNVAFFAQRLLTSMDITLIVLAILQLCVNISVAVLGIRALVNRKEKKEDVQDIEYYKPLLKEVNITSPGA